MSNKKINTGIAIVSVKQLNKMKYSFLVSLLFLINTVFGQNSILIVGPTIHVGNGKVIEQGLVGIENGKISLVRNALAFTFQKEDWDTIIYAKGTQLYPGFIAPNSTLGLTEIDAVRATLDFQEVGQFNPHIRSLTAFNTDSKVIATVRTNGVLLTQTTPRGGNISGSSSIMHLNGENWEDAVMLIDDGIHINWPYPYASNRWKGQINENKNYIEQLSELKDFLTSAKAYLSHENNQNIDLRFEAFREVFTGTKRLYFHANELKQLLDIIDYVTIEKIPFPVIIGGYDSYLIADQIKDAKISVMLPRVHNLPDREDDPTDLPYRLPFLLQQEGVLYCIQNEGDMEAMNARNIPFLAGTAKAYGLTEEEAIQAITMNPAKIMGISHLVGSIEEGKNACLFISEGNALDMLTNRVSTAIVSGKFVNLSNHQTDLYEKYKAKYERKN